MGVVRHIEIDLTGIVSGTPEFFAVGDSASGIMASMEIEQVSVSLAGVILKMVQSNSEKTWTDVLEDEDDPSSTIEATTTATSDAIFLASDFQEMSKIGLSIDVAGATTGTLVVYFNDRNVI